MLSCPACFILLAQRLKNTQLSPSLFKTPNIETVIASHPASFPNASSLIFAICLDVILILALLVWTGSQVEALRMLGIAEQAASQASGFPQKEALGRIQLAKAAVQCDR